MLFTYFEQIFSIQSNSRVIVTSKFNEFPDTLGVGVTEEWIPMMWIVTMRYADTWMKAMETIKTENTNTTFQPLITTAEQLNKIIINQSQRSLYKVKCCVVKYCVNILKQPTVLDLIFI